MDFSRAEHNLHESKLQYESSGDLLGAARQQYHLAVAAWLQDDHAGAVERAEVALALTRSAGDHWAEGWTLAVLGTIDRLAGDLKGASSWMDQSHQVFSEHGGTLDLGWSHLRLAAIARDEGDYQGASTQYRAGRDLLDASGDVLGVAHADAGLGALAWLSGDHESAVDLYLGVLQGFGLLEEASTNLFELKTMIQGNPTTEQLRQVVEDNRLRAKRVEGAKGAKAAMAEYLYHMGKTAHRQMDLDRAKQALTESGRLCKDAEDMRGLAIAVAALAVISHQQDDPRAASRLFGLAERLVAENRDTPWPPPDEPEYSSRFESLAREFSGFDQERARGAEDEPTGILTELV
jgi:hypothetical protein